MQAQSRLEEMEKGSRHKVPSLAKELWAIDSDWQRDSPFSLRVDPWKIDQVLVEGHTAKDTLASHIKLERLKKEDTKFYIQWVGSVCGSVRSWGRGWMWSKHIAQHSQWTNERGWRVFSVVKHTYVSCRRHRFSSQNPLGFSKASGTLFPWIFSAFSQPWQSPCK